MSSPSPRVIALSTAAVLLAACGSDAPPAAPPAEAAKAPPPPAAVALVARQVLYGNPERTGGSISPDGKWLGYIAPLDGVMNVFVAPIDRPSEAKPVTHDSKRPIREFRFAYDGKHLIYPQDEGGDENFRMHVVGLEDASDRALTPAGARADVLSLSSRQPGAVLLQVNDRNKQFFDVVRYDLDTGKSERLVENDGYEAFLADDDFKLRFATKPTADGGYEWFQREGANWKSWAMVPQEDALTTQFAGMSADGKTLYYTDSRGRDTSGLFAFDTESHDTRLLKEDPRADVGGAIVDPKTGVPQAVAVNYLRTEWVALDPAIQKDLDALKKIGDGEFVVESRTLDDSSWVVLFSASNASAKYYLYNRATGATTQWIDTRPKLADAPLVTMHPLEIKARDGLTLVSYLSLPKAADPDGDGKPTAPVPMVLLVHGGPWGRDTYGLNRTHQWLANRGYAVLSVNFRASTGFGKKFLNAGNLEWGKKMHDDLLDAVDWAVKSGVTVKDKVAIMGGSYGGYATLAGVTMTPKEFACGVDIVGPSNLMTLLNSIPPYWASFRKQFYTRMGDPDTDAGKALLKERSPLSYADKIERPLLIGQGKNDPRVNVAESEQIVAAMKAKNIPVTYVLFPDEGHGFARPANNIAFNAITEGFLGKCLGGRVEPIGADFDGSSLQVPEGAALLDGLEAAVKAHEAAATPAAAKPDDAPKPAGG